MTITVENATTFVMQVKANGSDAGSIDPKKSKEVSGDAPLKIEASWGNDSSSSTFQQKDNGKRWRIHA